MKDVALVGLPFSGKSTVFNAVARAHAATGGGAEKANVAVVSVPDPRVDELARLHASKKVAHAQVRLVDVPGLSARSLGEARASDALAIVLRGFGDDSDPVRDLARFRAELAVADLATMEKVLERARRQAKAGTPQARAELELAERAESVLSDDRWLAAERWTSEERRALHLLGPLTIKPVLHVVNADESFSQGRWPGVPEPSVAVKGLLESEASELSEAEAAALMAEFGVSEPAAARFVRSVYGVLGLVTFFTVNEQEAHAWEVPRGTKAVQAAGVVHSDFERSFIRCEVETYDALVAAGSREAAREQGAMRLEGRDYEVREGDVLFIRHSP